MSEFQVVAAEVRWLRIPLAKPIADATHRIESMDFVILTLSDSADREGVGYMLGFDYATDVMFHATLDAARKATGTDTRLRNQTWQALWTGYEYVGREGIASWGLSAVDLALWDLYGHQVGQPVWSIVGGARKSIPAYGSGGWLSMSVPEMVAEAETYLKRGLGGYKMKVGLGLTEDIGRVSAVREAIGDDVRLMIDANQGYNLAQARRLAGELSGLGLGWFEEPMPIARLSDIKVLRETMDIPLALGERSYLPAGILPFIEARAADVIMPDALRVGGVRGWLDVAACAAAADLQLSPHFYREYDTALAVATNASVIVENFFWTDEILEWDAAYRDGHVVPGDTPGFGIRIRSDAKDNYTVKVEQVQA